MMVETQIQDLIAVVGNFSTSHYILLPAQWTIFNSFSFLNLADVLITAKNEPCEH